MEQQFSWNELSATHFAVSKQAIELRKLWEDEPHLVWETKRIMVESKYDVHPEHPALEYEALRDKLKAMMCHE